jgi:nitroimidazol reductase NimA-like FMN-containing flavoprotein (pyridoxamine 5'-phosphate oxidase superfamily)
MDVKSIIRDLLDSQRLAVLATHERGQPYTSLVTFAADPDLCCLLFPTLRSTRKFANLAAEPRVALLVDNRTNQVSDLHEAYALTVLGTAIEATGDDRQAMVELYLARNPQLRDFVLAADCAMVKVQVQRYLLVRRFQELVELEP